MKKFFGILLLLVLTFYDIYPKGISFFGYSAIFTTGLVGLLVFLFERKFYKEEITVLFSYMPFVICCVITSYVNNVDDPYLLNYTKSQSAWFFSTYLIIYLFFKIHPKGSFFLLLYYILGAISIQGVISLAMYNNPAINDFFLSLQMIDALEIYKRELTEGERLLGYGTAFFGAGIIYGTALILSTYIILRKKLNFIQLLFWCSVYSFSFFIGLLSARTTMIGFFLSLILAVILLFFGKKIPKNQFFKFLAFIALFSSVGYTLCYVYFPEFADWAFEAFINYSETGEFSTQSSSGISDMFILPQNLKQWMFGIGVMEYWGPDVGYTRLLYYIGLPGTIAFFFYQLMLCYLAFTKERAEVFTLLALFACSLILNIKGLADLNNFIYFFVLYFLYYKYNIYKPKRQPLGKRNSAQFHYALQSQTSDRGI